MRSASFLDFPAYFSLFSMCSACRFCLSVKDDLSPWVMTSAP